MPGSELAATAGERQGGRRKTMIGVVVSNKMDKTAVVAVERRMQHPLYKKIIRRTKRYKAHDEANEARLGDVVRIAETRPISKEKRWRIAETLVIGNVADIAPRDIGAPEEAILPVAIEAPVVEPAVAEAPAAIETVVEAPVVEPAVAEAPAAIETAVAETAVAAAPVVEEVVAEESVAPETSSEASVEAPPVQATVEGPEDATAEERPLA
jgi:small subunit ribosomal protein S17